MKSPKEGAEGSLGVTTTFGRKIMSIMVASMPVVVEFCIGDPLGERVRGCS